MEKTQVLRYLHHPTELNAETLAETKALTEQFPWFQAGWMLYLKNLKAVNSSDFDAVLKKVALLVPDRKQLYKFINDEIRFKTFSEVHESFRSVYSLAETRTDVSGDSLIDKFLSTERGSFKRVSSEHSNSENTNNVGIIEKSSEENEELITETLARIYFEQQKYEKALFAYQKLSLKYPEKSIYFASRIKEIEVIKNNI